MSKILVIDDNEMIRSSVAATLSREGYSVTTLARGHEALARLDLAAFDTVLSDIRAGGDALMEAVRRADQTIPVIMMTIDGTAASAVALLESGAYDYVTKPISPAALVHTVRRAVEHRSLAREHRILRETLQKVNGRPAIDVTPASPASMPVPTPSNGTPTPPTSPATTPQAATFRATVSVESKPDPEHLICGSHYRLADLERDAIVATLQYYDGHRQRSAKALGIGVRTLGLKLKKWKELRLVSPSL